MKKIGNFLSIIALIASVNGFAQVKKVVSATQATLTSKDSALCKQWKLVSTEAFGVENPATEAQKNDAITFTFDRNVFFTKDGKADTGTWTLDKSKTYIALTFPETKQSIRFKLMEVDDQRLRYEYQDEHLIRTIYNYGAVKK